MDQQINKRWAAVDWGDKAHVICIVDADGKELRSLKIEHTAEGLSEMVSKLNELGPISGVAVETTHGLVVHKLLEANLPVFAINPKLSSTWREAHSVAGCKSDRGDSYVLANGLRMMHDQLHALKPDDPLTRRLQLLTDAECRFINDHTRCAQRLLAAVKEYYPAALQMFDGWASAPASDFILAFPAPQDFRRASDKKLLAFLKDHRLHSTPERLKAIEDRKVDSAWPSDQTTVQAKSMEAIACAKELRTLDAILQQYRAQIEQLFDQHPDHDIFASLPSCGPKLAPRMLSHFGTQRDRYESARSLQQLSGTVPVTKESGNHKEIKMRRMCDKDFRNTMHLYAQVSVRTCAWARAVYSRAIERGNGKARALRKVAEKWLKIIYRMWHDHQPYDESRYLASLIRRGSNLVKDAASWNHSG